MGVINKEPTCLRNFALERTLNLIRQLILTTPKYEQGGRGSLLEEVRQPAISNTARFSEPDKAPGAE
jgi:hypothetical protein